MDWFTVVLLIIFFVLPLVQQMLNKGQQEQPPPTDGDLEGGGVAVEREPPRVARPRVEPESSGGGWAEGWTPWPEAGQEEAQVGEKLEPEPISWSPPESLRDEEPYLMPETPTVPEEQRYRLPEMPPLRDEQPYRMPEVVAALPELRQVPAIKPRSLPAAGPVRSRSRIHLRGGTRELKRAIVLKEILGPPTALRDPEQDRIW